MRHAVIVTERFPEMEYLWRNLSQASWAIRSSMATYQIENAAGDVLHFFCWGSLERILGMRIDKYWNKCDQHYYEAEEILSHRMTC